MPTDRIGAKIAYVCIYSDSADHAARHLANLVRDRACGLDEGPEEWRAAIGELLQSDKKLINLNHLGAAFSIAEWRQILREVSAAIGTPGK